MTSHPLDPAALQLASQCLETYGFSQETMTRLTAVMVRAYLSAIQPQPPGTTTWPTEDAEQIDCDKAASSIADMLWMWTREGDGSQMPEETMRVLIAKRLARFVSPHGLSGLSCGIDA